MKILSVTIRCFMVLLIVTFSANMMWGRSAPAGSGTFDDPYLIASAGNWDQISSDIAGGNRYDSKFFKLTDDITVTTMLGTGDYSFRGIFDGAGHTKDGSTINISNCLFDGKFGGGNTNKCGGFVGYAESNAKVQISSSLFAPSAINVSKTDNISHIFVGNIQNADKI